MKRLDFVVARACAALVGTGAPAAVQVAGNCTPAVFSASVGWYDFKVQDNEAADFRLEYRHDEDFLWLKPWGGVEVTSDGAVWGGIGILVDVTVFDAVVLTGSFAPGLYEDGRSEEQTSELQSLMRLSYAVFCL